MFKDIEVVVLFFVQTMALISGVLGGTFKILGYYTLASKRIFKGLLERFLGHRHRLQALRIGDAKSMFILQHLKQQRTSQT